MVRITVSLLTLGLASLISAQGTQFITGECTSDADCASGCCGFTSGKCAGAIVAQERDGGCGFGDAQPNDRAAVALGFTGSVGNGQSAAGNGNANANNNSGSGSASAGAAQNSNPPAGMGNGNGNAGNGNNGGANNGAANNGAANNGAANNGGADGGAAGGNGAQFITGECTSDADCASGCCGFNSGKCAGPVVAQERDGGCGFGDGTPNDNAAQAFRAGAKRGLKYQWE